MVKGAPPELPGRRLLPYEGVSRKSDPVPSSAAAVVPSSDEHPAVLAPAADKDVAKDGRRD
ncbi:hypothetical protein [Streptomyces sp. NPDC101166]|uniref:hypothetical protein n=1 Tax=Streptomyces sp. NPDC101166 TaxID=3366120 RepID=UPI00380AB919